MFRFTKEPLHVPDDIVKNSRAQTRSWPYVHGGVDLADGLVVRGELVYLHAVAHQLAHDLDFELVQLTLGDRVRFGDDGDDVDLRRVREKQSYIGPKEDDRIAQMWKINRHWRLIKDMKPSKVVQVVDGAHSFNVY